METVEKITFIFQGNAQASWYYRTLLSFAFYSGIGVKTTQGMGRGNAPILLIAVLNFYQDKARGQIKGKN